MRILITGGCGFIGCNLIARLNAIGGFQIRVFDNESLGKREHLAGLDAEFVHGDIRDQAAVLAALDTIDAVVHLAADTRVIESIEKPAYNFEVNVVGSLNVLQAMRTRGIKHIVNASTGGAIIGEAVPPVHEKMVASPTSPYGASKLAVEGYCSAFTGSYGFKAISLRFSNVYGPRSFHKGSVVAAFLRQIMANETLTVYGDGNQTRDFVFVDDLCDGIIAGLKGDVAGVVQLGSGRPTSVNELIDAMKPVVAPHEVEVDYVGFRTGELVLTYCDIAKARSELGFQPNTSLAVGLGITWKWFNEHQAMRREPLLQN